MFFTKEIVKEVDNSTEVIKGLKTDYAIEIRNLNADHEISLKNKEFELKHFKDEELKKLELDNFHKSQKIAVLEKEVEMLKQITELNADVIDVKDLVKNLIDKLPEVKISSLSVTGQTNPSK